ncbi:MAG: hypothetical protein ISS79_03030 [Phycisphaerae bacterium]|nr:hypothetical protein [Phycisphaerae bacterium]
MILVPAGQWGIGTSTAERIELGTCFDIAVLPGKDVGFDAPPESPAPSRKFYPGKKSPI